LRSGWDISGNGEEKKQNNRLSLGDMMTTKEEINPFNYPPINLMVKQLAKKMGYYCYNRAECITCKKAKDFKCSFIRYRNAFIKAEYERLKENGEFKKKAFIFR
jgi:hypothetical protein